MVRVCDAIMGSGKTSAAINYMNRYGKTKKFIYVTPYIDETQRIKEGCPELNFWVPRQDLKEYDFKKKNHFKVLVEEEKNISITHKLASMLDKDTISLISEKKYTIIIDETVEVFEKVDVSESDMSMITDSNWMTLMGTGGGDTIEYYEKNNEKVYQDGLYMELFRTANTHRLIKTTDKNGKEMFWMWTLDDGLFTCSDEIFILTYMFEHTMLRCYRQINGIPYRYIYIYRPDGKTYEFSDDKATIPESVGTLSSKIHIFENEKLNDIGKNKHALSYSWVNKQAKSKNGKLERVRKNIVSYFQYHCPKLPSSTRLWSTYNCGVPKLRAKGHYRSDLSFNSRATNNYRYRRLLAYCVNIFCNPNMMNYFRANNIKFSEDGYALSTMIQWIWRSAIRDGKEIWIYIPSRRMRTLLKNWIKETEEQYRQYKENINEQNTK